MPHTTHAYGFEAKSSVCIENSAWESTKSRTARLERSKSPAHDASASRASAAMNIAEC